MGVRGVTVLWSDELPITSGAEGEGGGRVPASISFVPSAAGLLIASVLVRAVIGGETQKHIPILPLHCE
jgi:tRNA A37 threonylcarbamoyladenosine dehydratase